MSDTPVTPTFYAIIPADVRYDKSLSASQKLLYGEITALCSKEGFCWATNAHFAELYDRTASSISVMISGLAAKGYISVYVDKENGNRRIISIVPREGGMPGSRHIPLSKNRGGSPKKSLDPSNEKSNGQYNNTSLSKHKDYSSPLYPPIGGSLAPEEVEELAREDGDFQAFWDAYPATPHKGRYRSAFQEWSYKQRSGALPPIDTLLEALSEQKECRYTDPKYIPSPAKWLREEEWRFEVDPGDKAASREANRRRREEEFREMYKGDYTEAELKAFALKHGVFLELFPDGEGGKDG